MSKGIVIVVECISSAVNYVTDIKNEGYEPVLLEPYSNIFERPYMRRFHDDELGYMLDKNTVRPRIIMAKSTYSKTLEQIKKLSPVAILPGSDKGIELATKLAHDLGIIGNNPDNLPKIRDKFICQQALKNAGIRYIKSELVGTYDEALAFFRLMAEKGKGVVVKPVLGISSIGVYVCKTEKELKDAFDKNKNNFLYRMYNGGTGKILIQECIDGIEYIVDTVSSEGISKVTLVCRYSKRTVPGKGRLYDNCISLDSKDPLVSELSEYQFKVLDAIGIEYGAVHSEIMMDEEGPVLIEANCRIAGGIAKADYLKECIGISESEYSLRTYLYHNAFIDTPHISYTEVMKTDNPNICLTNTSPYTKRPS